MAMVDLTEKELVLLCGILDDGVTAKGAESMRLVLSALDKLEKAREAAKPAEEAEGPDATAAPEPEPLNRAARRRKSRRSPTPPPPRNGKAPEPLVDPLDPGELAREASTKFTIGSPGG